VSETTTYELGGAAATASSDGEVALPPAEARGGLQIADRVVERIAARAVSEVEHATGVSRQLLGLGRGRSRTTARVSASVDRDIATLQVTMTVLWPASVPEVTQRVREHIASRLAELASLRTVEVDIEVAGLPTAYGPRPRRVT
jgi:uncharacterized alkaline shock family protein YloU